MGFRTGNIFSFEMENANFMSLAAAGGQNSIPQEMIYDHISDLTCVGLVLRSQEGLQNT